MQLKSATLKIWIDLSNSPHVLFFKPIIEELHSLGHTTIVTHRDFAQTSKLCEIYEIKSACIGEHGGQGILRKANNIIGRARALRAYAKARGINFAISHNSYAHCLAAKSLNIPYMTIMDYEFQPANHISFRIADMILVPFTFKFDDIKKYGVKERKLTKYPGLKEEVYLWNFEQETDFWKNEFPDLDDSKVICTIRPPANMAAYHNFENPIFYDLLAFLLGVREAQVIVFARTSEQRIELRNQFPNLFMPQKSVDGGQLIANSDLIISAGGTMNREAAALATPAYTVYAGKIGSVDNHLIACKKVVKITKIPDFEKIKLRKKKDKSVKPDRTVFNFLIKEIINFRHSYQMTTNNSTAKSMC